MDKQLEQRIRERAYELWMRHGSLPDRADEYWYQAEQEILRENGSEQEDDLISVMGGGEDAPVEASPAPLGMTSQTLDEVLNAPAPPKARRRKSAAAAAADTSVEVNEAAGETVAASKRKRPRKATP